MRNTYWLNRFRELEANKKSAERGYYAVACSHEKSETRRLVKSNGSIEVRQQCLSCGSSLKTLRKSEVQFAEKLPVFDLKLRDDGHASKAQGFSSIKTDYQALFNSLYQEYLASSDWLAIRKKVMLRDNHTCQGCLEQPAEQVHHQDYRHIGSELLFELISVCRACHVHIHS